MFWEVFLLLLSARIENGRDRRGSSRLEWEAPPRGGKVRKNRRKDVSENLVFQEEASGAHFSRSVGRYWSHLDRLWGDLDRFCVRFKFLETLRPSDPQTFRPSGPQTLRPSDPQTLMMMMMMMMMSLFFKHSGSSRTWSLCSP